MNHIIPFPPVPPRKLNLVPNKVSAAPMLAPTSEGQTTMSNFLAGKSRREYLADESIYSQGDIANAVFYIQSGRVKLTVVSASGKEAVIAHLHAGSFFGETALSGETHRSCSVYALQSSTIVRIEKTIMMDLLSREPEFAEQFLSYLLSRNIRMVADLVDHLFNSSEKRLARLLMLMANYGQESPPEPQIAKISQETLAEMIGTTRSRVSFFLNRFRDLGYINYNSEGMQINASLVNVVLGD
jgi:CRP/FNR family cyclic AMP-dependent transcriptional regulator